MIDFNPVTNEKGNCIAVGRGAIAIRLALESIKKENGKVLVPANICYAAVLPVIYAGYEPLFCDVDNISGNITMDLVRQISTVDVVAAIIPHMYGNPVKELYEIVDYFHERDIVVIEDCASMMTNTGKEYTPGTLGDFVVYSTGYSKTIDIGYGGLLYSSKYKLKDLEEIERRFDRFNSDYEQEWSIFSAIYRVLRNTNQYSALAQSLYKNLPDVLKPSYTFSLSAKEKQKILDIIINDLDDVIRERKRKYSIYYDLLNCKDCIYEFDQDAVPWRFNLIIGEERKKLIDYCLERKVPVSDWYPLVTPIFRNKEHFEGAEWHEKHIVNFPILISDEQIFNICKTINSFYKDNADWMVS